MSLWAISLVLLSASIHVGWNYLTKSSSNPRVFSLIKGSYGILIFGLVAPFIPFASIPFNVWIYVILSGIIHAVYITALSSAYETGDISFVYPIARSAPAVVPIAAFFFLNETLSYQGIAGIVIVIVCVFLIQLRGEARTGLKMVWVSLKQKDSIWAFVTLFAVVSYTLVDKAGMVALSQVEEIRAGLHGPVYYLFETTLCYLLFWAYIWRNSRHVFNRVLKQEGSMALVASLGTMASYSLILHVMQTETVSYIVTLRQSSVLIAVLAGWFFLKEPYGRFRLLIAAVMLYGFFLVATAS